MVNSNVLGTSRSIERRDSLNSDFFVVRMPVGDFGIRSELWQNIWQRSIQNWPMDWRNGLAMSIVAIEEMWWRMWPVEAHILVILKSIGSLLVLMLCRCSFEGWCEILRQ